MYYIKKISLYGTLFLNVIGKKVNFCVSQKHFIMLSLKCTNRQDIKLFFTFFREISILSFLQI